MSVFVIFANFRFLTNFPEFGDFCQIFQFFAIFSRFNAYELNFAPPRAQPFKHGQVFFQTKHSPASKHHFASQIRLRRLQQSPISYLCRLTRCGAPLFPVRRLSFLGLPRASFFPKARFQKTLLFPPSRAHKYATASSREMTRFARICRLPATRDSSAYEFSPSRTSLDIFCTFRNFLRNFRALRANLKTEIHSRSNPSRICVLKYLFTKYILFTK